MEPLIAVHSIAAAALVVIAVLLAVRPPAPGPKGEPGDPGPPGPPGSPGAPGKDAEPAAHVILPPATASPAPGPVWETLKRAGDQWVHLGWVRAATPAWQRAYDTAGIALRHAPDHPIEEGKQ